MFPRHAPDIVSLVFGTIFATFSVVWLLHLTEVIDTGHAFLAVPAALVLAGAAGLVAALRPHRRRGHEDQPPARPSYDNESPSSAG